MTASTRTRTRAMTVGELSRHTGVSTKNLRSYTDDGLIYTIGRSPSGYRLYDTEAVWCVQLISELRGLGLTLAEIRALTTAALDRTGRRRGPQLADLLEASRARLRARITEMEQTLRRIDDFEARHHDRLTHLDGDCWPGDPRPPVRA